MVLWFHLHNSIIENFRVSWTIGFADTLAGHYVCSVFVARH